MTLNRQGDSWTRLIALYVVVTQAGVGILTALRAEPSGTYFLLNHFIFLLLVGFWFEAENRRTQVMRIWDLGIILYVAWPIVLAYHLVKSRGIRRALKIVLGWVALFYGVAILAFSVAFFSLEGAS